MLEFSFGGIFVPYLLLLLMMNLKVALLKCFWFRFVFILFNFKACTLSFLYVLIL